MVLSLWTCKVFVKKQNGGAIWITFTSKHITLNNYVTIVTNNEIMNRIDDAMVGIYAVSVVYPGFESLAEQTKDYAIGI